MLDERSEKTSAGDPACSSGDFEPNGMSFEAVVVGSSKK